MAAVEGRPVDAAEEEVREAVTVSAARRFLLVVHQVERTAARIAGWSVAAGGFLGLSLVVWLRSGPAWVVIPAFLVALMLILPAAVLAVFSAGLGQLRRLPHGLLDDSASFFAALPGGTDAGARGALQRLWLFARNLLRSRAALAAARDRIVGAGLFLRVLHPLMLLAVLAAVVATSLLLPAAVIVALVLAL